ncbi:MAG: hypothetical protein M3Q39_16015 [Actinomycetota bacterium]|nr:hypothetical protein [Actinomycetota bacterium]
MDVIMASPNTGGATQESRAKTVTEARGRWLIANGYAFAVGGNPNSQILTNGVEQSAETNLGINREVHTADMPEGYVQDPATTAVGRKITPGDHASHLTAAETVGHNPELANA